MSCKRTAFFYFFCLFSFVLFADGIIGTDENRVKADSMRVVLSVEKGEIRAIQTWTNGGIQSNYLQKLLLDPKKFDNPVKYPASRDTVRIIDSVLERSKIKIAVTVYRVMGLSLEDFEDLVGVRGILDVNGNVDTNRLSNIRFRHKTYAASSFDEQIAKDLVIGKKEGDISYTKEWKYLLVLKINVPVGTNCLYIYDRLEAKHHGQRELLIARDQDMRVKGTPQNKGSVPIPPARELKEICIEVDLEKRDPTPIP